jgi:hypothetical protein
MTRVVIKLGNIFQVCTGKGRVKFFQYIGVDDTQLGSAVIRAFEQEYATSETVDLALVAQGKVAFHAHCQLRTGLRMNCWTKAGNTPIAMLPAPLFRHTFDYGRVAGQEPILLSTNWTVWQMNEPMQKVGKLEGENQQAEIGLVMNCYDIVRRILHGAYDMLYPAFE